ncbi:MAG: hypothetical protein IKP88_14790 [Lachnospiraceae bacterium]|nr:hypothetical protein [Lachnospiraceae bacterium]
MSGSWGASFGSGLWSSLNSQALDLQARKKARMEEERQKRLKEEARKKALEEQLQMEALKDYSLLDNLSSFTSLASGGLNGADPMEILNNIPGVQLPNMSINGVIEAENEARRKKAEENEALKNTNLLSSINLKNARINSVIGENERKQKTFDYNESRRPVLEKQANEKYNKQIELYDSRIEANKATANNRNAHTQALAKSGYVNNNGNTTVKARQIDILSEIRTLQDILEKSNKELETMSPDLSNRRNDLIKQINSYRDRLKVLNGMYDSGIRYYNPEEAFKPNQESFGTANNNSEKTTTNEALKNNNPTNPQTSNAEAKNKQGVAYTSPKDLGNSLQNTIEKMILQTQEDERKLKGASKYAEKYAKDSYMKERKAYLQRWDSLDEKGRLVLLKNQPDIAVYKIKDLTPGHLEFLKKFAPDIYKIIESRKAV